MSDLQVINHQISYTPQQIDLIKRTICKGSTDDELQMFMYQCNKVQLDPFTRQIWSIERRSKKDDGTYEKSRTTQVSIDGFRLIAERTGKYEGQTEPQWCGKDRVWFNVWVDEFPPVAARVGIYKAGFKEPIYAVARYRSYCQTKNDGKPTKFWSQMPDVMLAKCAESLALRKGFPLELSGLYTPEEMGQADIIYDGKDNQPQPTKNTTTKTIRDPKKIITLSEKIIECLDMDSLKEAYRESVKYARELKDKNLEGTFLTYKENRKNEIQKKIADDYLGEETPDEPINS